jgi:HSP20 family protein
MSAILNKPESQAAAPDRPLARRYVTPIANIYGTKDGYVVEAEMPGVGKEDIEVTLDNNEVVIVGRRRPEPSRGEAVYRESQDVDYRRAFELDPAIDTGRISAKIEQGLLTLSLPKAEAVKPRKIAVND